MSSTTYALSGSTAVITFNSPPVNGMSYELRSSILADFDKATADPAPSPRRWTSLFVAATYSRPAEVWKWAHNVVGGAGG